ncbi:MAG TPA: phosphate ABC transporter permease PstA [Ilumatobacter sp.]
MAVASVGAFTADSIVGASLSGRARAALGAGALLAGVALAAVAGGVAPVRAVLLAGVVYVVAVYVVSRRVEGRRRAFDRLMTALVTAAFALVVVPLVSVIWTTIDRGAARFDADFLTQTMRGVVGAGGGAKHAIIGTLIVTGIAAALSVPVGIFVAIYLVEYGKRNRLSTMITTMVDVMTGIPSIVAGLFAYSLFVLLQGPGARSGLAGAVALSVLMTPVVVRATEEMLRLVPDELREAAFALGVPKWRTIVKVVLPTAIAGILTGVTLAIARVIGETAPLLIASGLAQDTNLNPFSGRMTTLPVVSYYGYVAPGFPPEAGYDRGWAAALALIIIVLVLFTIARVIAKVLQPKGLR